MAQVSDFYQVLGVPPDTEPEAVRENIRDRVDEFRQQVDEADDPGAVRSRLVLAYEVLTDPEERYLYELYGHDQYMNKRLDSQGFDDVSDIGGGSLTPVFSGETTTSDTEVFDPASGDTTDTQIFDPEASEAAVGGATTVVDGPQDAGPEAPEASDGPSVDSDTDTVGQEDETDEVADSQTVVKDEDDDADGETDTKEETPSESETDELAELSQQPTLVDQLSRFPLQKSPLITRPGIGDEEYHRPAAVGYAIVALGVVFAAGMFLPSGSVMMGAVTVGGAVLGVGATYVAGALQFDKKVGYRACIGGAFAVPIFFVPSLGLVSVTPAAVLAYGGAAACLLGVAVSNTYIEATRKQIREGRKEEDDRGGSNYTETDPTVGEADGDIDPEAVLETLVESAKGTTGKPPDDLPEESEFHATRQFMPERHIHRVLEVHDERTGKEVPASDFSSVRSTLREDIHNRNNNYPSGFSERTDEYLDPTSVTKQTCSKCTGSTTVQCPNCGGNGQVACRKCGGSARNKCRSCNGKGRDSNGNLCSNCRGDGYNPCSRCSATGRETCGTCSGSGKVTCGRCEGDGTVVQFTQLTRQYEPGEQVEYETKSLPESPLHSPDGNQVKKDRKKNSNPDAISGDWFFREHRVREIPTDVVTYEYAGDLWEAYEMEDGVKSPTFPRALGTRVQVLAAASVASAVLFGYIVTIGPSGLP